MAPCENGVDTPDLDLLEMSSGASKPLQGMPECLSMAVKEQQEAVTFCNLWQLLTTSLKKKKNVGQIAVNCFHSKLFLSVSDVKMWILMEIKDYSGI